MANIRVTFRVEFGVDLGRTPPPPITLVIPEKCTVFNLVQIARENSTMHSFKYCTYPDFGAEITTIDGVEEDPTNGTYWFFYTPWNKLITNGVSCYKLRQNTTLVARYEHWTKADHSKQKALGRQFMNTGKLAKSQKKRKNDKNNNIIYNFGNKSK